MLFVLIRNLEPTIWVTGLLGNDVQLFATKSRQLSLTLVAFICSGIVIHSLIHSYRDSTQCTRPDLGDQTKVQLKL